MEIAKKHRDQLERIKENITRWHDYFSENCRRFEEMKRFVFQSTLTDKDRSILAATKKPIVEFNILEAYVSRQRGAFAQNEFGVEVSSKDGSAADADVVKFVSDHIRYILSQACNEGFQYEFMTDTLSGGFSSACVYTEHASPVSFDHEIKIKKHPDPTLVGFDPMAQERDKSDGEYCFQIVPLTKTEFDRLYPGNKAEVSASASINGFRWSYKSMKEEIILVADYFEKKHVKRKIVMLPSHEVMFKDEYEDMLLQWEADGIILQPPKIIAERETLICKIMRYKLIENKILEVEETDYRSLPYIYIDGNSQILKRGNSGAVTQYTRPYVYNAIGAQKLKNFIGQCLANEYENMMQHKIMMGKGAVPDGDYQLAFENPQLASVLVYQDQREDGTPVDKPQILPTPQIPSQLNESFAMTDGLCQMTLGSFDTTISKMSEQEISGKAIQEAATLSNETAAPYHVSGRFAIQAIANRILELIPIYYNTPRTIPVLDAQGNKSYVKVNQDGGISLDYNSDALRIQVTAGAPYHAQQDKALAQINAQSQASPLFAEFINTAGLSIFLDNMHIRGIEELKRLAEEWNVKKEEEAKLAAESMIGQMSPEEQKYILAEDKLKTESMLKMQELKLKEKESRRKTLIELARLKNEIQKDKIDMIKALNSVKLSTQEMSMKAADNVDDKIKDATEIALKSLERTEDGIMQQFANIRNIAQNTEVKN